MVKKDTCSHTVVVRSRGEELFSIDESGIKLCRPEKIPEEVRCNIVRDLNDLARVIDPLTALE